MSHVEPGQEPPQNNNNNNNEISWKVPVAAAILGALLVGAFVVYAIVVGPVDSTDAAIRERSAVGSAALPSSELPPGFVALPSGIGLKAQSVVDTDATPEVAVSSAVPGDDEPGQVPPDEIAFWELQTSDGTEIMNSQVARLDAPGVTTVTFDGQPPGDLQHIIAYVATDSSRRQTVIESREHITGEPASFTVDVAGGAVLTGVVWIGDGGGFVEWSVDGAMPAKVNVIASLFETTDRSSEQHDEILLGPEHQLSAADRDVSAAMEPLYGFNGSYELLPSDGETIELTTTTAVSIEITTETVTAVTPGVAVSLPPGG